MRGSTCACVQVRAHVRVHEDGCVTESASERERLIKKCVRRCIRPRCMKQDRRARHHNHIHINNERMMAAGSTPTDGT